MKSKNKEKSNKHQDNLENIKWYSFINLVNKKFIDDVINNNIFNIFICYNDNNSYNKKIYDYEDLNKVNLKEYFTHYFYNKLRIRKHNLNK